MSTPYEKLKACLEECKIPFKTTDDSEEYPIKDDMVDFSGIKDTVIVLKGDDGTDPFNKHKEIFIFFNKEGNFKNDISIV